MKYGNPKWLLVENLENIGSSIGIRQGKEVLKYKMVALIMATILMAAILAIEKFIIRVEIRL